MRIGLLLRSLDDSKGIGLYTRYVLREMMQLGRLHDYLLVYRNPAHLGAYAHLPHVREVALSAPNKLMWDQVAVPRLAEAEGLDVLFHTKFAVPLATRCKTITVLHGSEWYINPQFYPLPDQVYSRTLVPLYLKRADAAIAVSNCARDDIARILGADARKIKTVYLAANERFRVIDDPALLAATRDKYGLPEHYMVFVGKIYPGKNIGNLLRAFARIKDRVPHSLVLIGGTLWDYEADLALIDQFGLRDRVRQIDWIEPEELPAIYNLADLFVFPSWYESCPAPPWEAMACGCPVLTSHTGGTLEVVGDAAYLVDPSDVDGIADGMRRLLTDTTLRQMLVRNGFAQVKRFTWRRCAEETLDVIEQVVAQDSRASVAVG